MLFSDLILESAQEGIVLLRNTEQTLPLMHGDKVSVFGRMQYDFYRSGTGSGGSVHIPYSTNFTDSLIESAEQIGFELNTELSALYHQFIIDNPFDNGGGEWAGEPWSQKELELDDEIVKSAALHSNKAIVVIGRNSGEDKDFLREKGSYFLTDIEYSNLKKICGAFQNVILCQYIHLNSSARWFTGSRVRFIRFPQPVLCTICHAESSGIKFVN